MVLMVFDLLWERDVDLRGLPLSERLRDLARLCRKTRVRCLRWSNPSRMAPRCSSTAICSALKAS